MVIKKNIYILVFWQMAPSNFFQVLDLTRKPTFNSDVEDLSKSVVFGFRQHCHIPYLPNTLIK